MGKKPLSISLVKFYQYPKINYHITEKEISKILSFHLIFKFSTSGNTEIEFSPESDNFLYTPIPGTFPSYLRYIRVT